MKTTQERMAQQEYPFAFSVVMAVYNVEPFLREAVDSLIAQDFGFERVQLILVDDGSTDDSGAICDEYAAQYPDNVLVIHKENGGVSSARNEGLRHAQGRYVNFLDADDKLDEGTLSAVYDFFVDHEEDTDVVAIPMFFFDGATGAHAQNGKFRRGTRVIDLMSQWQVVHLSCASSFVRLEAAKAMRFDEELAYCEDGKEILRVLLDRMTLGLVKEGKYYYRRRTQGEASAIQMSYQNFAWYTPYLERMTQATISLCLERMGFIPKFVQNMLMYDLQWRLTLEEIPAGVMSPEETAQFKELLFSLFGYFDDDVIMAQDNIQVEHKAFALRKKYGRYADACWRHHSQALHYQNTYLLRQEMCKTHLDFITLTQSTLRVEGYTVLLEEGAQEVGMYLEVNGQRIPCAAVERKADRTSLGEPIYRAYGFVGEVELEPDVECYEITFFCEVDGQRLDRKKLVFGKYCPVSTEMPGMYYAQGGRVLTAESEKLTLQRCGRRGRAKREWAYLRALWKSRKTGARKAVLARLLVAFLALFVHRRVWLISDRPDRADDNGEAFFRYMVAARPKGIKPYFAISRGSPDYRRMKKVGRVVPSLGWRYKILYLLCDCVISSQAEEYIFHPFQRFSYLYRDRMQTQRFVFLQHGVIKDDLSDWLSRYNKNISMFVTTTAAEYASILACDYRYTEKVVRLTGLPRHDRLYRQEKKMITIMPTWRAYLVTGIDPATGTRALKPGFHESRYYAMYHELLNDQRLFDAAQRLGYTLALLNHPNMSCAMEAVGGDERVQRLGLDTTYRDVFAQSDLIVTDYSSVAFDFAYLRKPIVYYQADQDEFFSGAHTYKKGYFDYERDGFGEVEYSARALVDRIIEYMESGCQLKETYRQRIDATFPFADQENCKRVYEAILEMEKKS